LPGGGNQQKSKKSTEDFVQGNKDLRAIFAINDPSALGAYTALKQVGLEKQVTIVGFDGEQAGKQAIKDGKIFADPVQYPDKMAQITIQSIFEYFDGKKPEKLIKIPAELYFKEDAEKDPALK
jgi:ribose transport system substrate-binding protein